MGVRRATDSRGEHPRSMPDWPKALAELLNFDAFLSEINNDAPMDRRRFREVPDPVVRANPAMLGTESGALPHTRTPCGTPTDTPATSRRTAAPGAEARHR